MKGTRRWVAVVGVVIIVIFVIMEAVKAIAVARGRLVQMR
jgi:hypothetical protein